MPDRFKVSRFDVEEAAEAGRWVAAPLAALNEQSSEADYGAVVDESCAERGSWLCNALASMCRRRSRPRGCATGDA
jgi:hypothetical protein